jgi:hypothetical protein
MTDANDSPTDANAGDAAEGQSSAPEQVLDTLENIPEGELFWDDYVDPLYMFAFDHLMDQAYVSRFVRGLRPAKLVHLPHHRLCWPYYYPPQETAVPSLERTNDEEDRVWGILYQANKVDLSRLEEHLRVPNRYYRKSVIVMDRGGRRISAFSYALNQEATDSYKPSPAYLQRLVEAAEGRNLPGEWVAQLKSTTTE